MSAQLFDLRNFRTVRDNVRAAGMDPQPLIDQLRDAQRRGERGNAVVAAAQRLRRQMQDELNGGDVA